MLEEDKNIKDNIKDARNLFTLKKLKKETNDTVIKDIRSLFRLKKKEIKQLKIEHLVILEIFLSMKKKIITNQ